MRLAYRLPLLAIFAAIAAPQALELSPIVRTVRVPVDGPGEVVVTVRANGGYSSDFEPSDGSYEPQPEPTPTPQPQPQPNNDPLARLGRIYYDAVPSGLRLVADQVERGELTNHNEAVTKVEQSRAFAKQQFGTALQAEIDPLLDGQGDVIDRAAYAAILRRAAGGR